jgi:hypothetical protein
VISHSIYTYRGNLLCKVIAGEQAPYKCRVNGRGDTEVLVQFDNWWSFILGYGVTFRSSLIAEAICVKDDL